MPRNQGTEYLCQCVWDDSTITQTDSYKPGVLPPKPVHLGQLYYSYAVRKKIPKIRGGERSSPPLIFGFFSLDSKYLITFVRLLAKFLQKSPGSTLEDRCRSVGRP